ncbi:MAG: hypothetical protein RLZZ628_1053, partial [Bacteroidota bacterium]
MISFIFILEPLSELLQHFDAFILGSHNFQKKNIFLLLKC